MKQEFVQWGISDEERRNDIETRKILNRTGDEVSCDGSDWDRAYVPSGNRTGDEVSCDESDGDPAYLPSGKAVYKHRLSDKRMVGLEDYVELYGGLDREDVEWHHPAGWGDDDEGVFAMFGSNPYPGETEFEGYNGNDGGVEIQNYYAAAFVISPYAKKEKE
jgi:hypothetical protein